jgi:AAA+ ATPase superfamily predicted ATPase
VWDYIGGKVGDMVMLFEEKKQGYSEREALERMLEDTTSKLRDFLEAIEEGEKGEIDIKEVKEALVKVSQGETFVKEIRRKVRHFLVEKNILFYNPVKGIVRPQSQLIHRAITELLK